MTIRGEMHEVIREQVLSPLLTPVSSQRVDHTEDLAPHGHAFIEVVVVAGGSALHVSASGPRLVQRGCVMALRPGEWHGYQDCQDLRIIDVYIGPELFTRELDWIADDPHLGVVLRPPTPGRRALTTGETHVDAAAMQRLEGWCGELAMADRSSNRDRTMRLGHLVLILGEIAAAASPDGDTAHLRATAHPSILQAVRLLDSTLEVQWTLPALAHTVNLAPGYLVRLFGRHVGLPPIAYLNRIRAERMAVLLIETDLPVATIGAKVGWTDPTYVSRRFRACFAMTPAQYRAAFRPNLEAYGRGNRPWADFGIAQLRQPSPDPGDDAAETTPPHR